MIMKTQMKLFWVMILIGISTSLLSQKSSEISITADKPLEFKPDAKVTPIDYPYFALNIYLHNFDYFNNVTIPELPNQSKYLSKNYRGKLKFITAKVLIQSDDYTLEYPLFALKKTKNSFDINIARRIAILGLRPVKLNTTNTPKVSIVEMGEMKVVSDATKFIFQSVQSVLKDPTKFANPSSGILDILNDGMAALNSVVENDTRGFSGKATVTLIDFDDNDIYRYKYHAHIVMPKLIGLSPNEKFEIKFDTTTTGKVVDVYMTKKDSTNRYISHPYFIVEIGYTNYLNLNDLLPSQIINNNTFNTLSISLLDKSKAFLEENSMLLSPSQKKCEQELLRFLFNYKYIEKLTNNNATIEELAAGYDSYYNQRIGVTTPEIFSSSVYLNRFKALIDTVTKTSLNLKLSFKEDVDSIVALINKQKSLNYNNLNDIKKVHSEIYFYTNTFSSINEVQFFKSTKLFGELSTRKSLIERRVFDKYIKDTLDLLTSSLLERDYDNASNYFSKITEYKNSFSKFDYCLNEIEKVRNKYLAMLPTQFDNAKSNYEYLIKDLSNYSNQLSALNELLSKNKNTLKDLLSNSRDSLCFAKTEIDSAKYEKQIEQNLSLDHSIESILSEIKENSNEILIKQKELEGIILFKESDSERVKVVAKVNKIYSTYITFKGKMETNIEKINKNPAANMRYSQ
ncbi:MAG: hypothetical protein PHN56_04980 [Candidatus Nanoarchaeia archaeon]|nr:hypothetical protein [Candidatus Nanoarchaeia archaeon]